MKEKPLHYTRFESRLGLLSIASTKQGICALHYGDNARHIENTLAHQFPNYTLIENHDDLSTAITQIQEYLAGVRRNYTLSIDLHGSDFYVRAWKVLLAVAYGQTISYSELATRIGSPRASRAAGTACGKNPLPLIVPCHRVLAKGGALGGFGWGLEVKQKLLALEQSSFNQMLKPLAQHA